MNEYQEMYNFAIKDIDMDKVSNPLVARVLRQIKKYEGEEFVFKSGHTDTYKDVHTERFLLGSHFDEWDRVHKDRG
jgi:hypothetical protein|tara:strand:- start:1756 stop:1983 length:228 start_codon:yes stop_codon:yes gene_type:complete